MGEVEERCTGEVAMERWLVEELLGEASPLSHPLHHPRQSPLRPALLPALLPHLPPPPPPPPTYHRHLPPPLLHLLRAPAFHHAHVHVPAPLLEAAPALPPSLPVAPLHAPHLGREGVQGLLEGAGGVHPQGALGLGEGLGRTGSCFLSS